jgi:sporulation protein YlmC with PRC-barrel domain
MFMGSSRRNPIFSGQLQEAAVQLCSKRMKAFATLRDSDFCGTGSTQASCIASACRLYWLRAMRISDENLRGRTVIAADGQALGEVVAIFLDTETWRVDSLKAKLRNEVADQIGAARDIFHAGTVEIPIRMVQSVGDAVVLSVATQELRPVLPDKGGISAAH